MKWGEEFEFHEVHWNCSRKITKQYGNKAKKITFLHFILHILNNACASYAKRLGKVTNHNNACVLKSLRNWTAQRNIIIKGITSETTPKWITNNKTDRKIIILWSMRVRIIRCVIHFSYTFKYRYIVDVLCNRCFCEQKWINKHWLLTHFQHFNCISFWL